MTLYRVTRRFSSEKAHSIGETVDADKMGLAPQRVARLIDQRYLTPVSDSSDKGAPKKAPAKKAPVNAGGRKK